MLWTTYHRLVAAWIREKRKSSRLTQAQVALRSGISKVRISRLESGKTVATVEVLAQIASVYRIQPSDILKAVDQLRFELIKEGVHVQTRRHKRDISEPGCLEPIALQWYEGPWIPGTFG